MRHTTDRPGESTIYGFRRASLGRLRPAGWERNIVRIGIWACLIGVGLLAAPTLAADRPNVVWITSEDNAAHWLGCYGNRQAQTPRLDALARQSLRFSDAYSNAPVCAVARCTLLHGVYATSLGTQHMRSRHAIPEKVVPYVRVLRDAGYYCSNRSKTDYNRKGNDRDIWDACGGKAHYRNRRDGQPFFAVFNLTVCHESCLFPQVVRRNRKRGTIPETPRVAPRDVILPPYLPDLPEVREDFAIYYDYLSALDAQVGTILDELRTSELADDTIVFYFSDHGGPTPRGKRYLADTGTRVPLLIHLPEKWATASPFGSRGVVDEPVGFVDFAPTLLSLCGLDIPSTMQGRSFLGEQRSEPSEGDDVFLFADRFDEIQGMRRGLTDGRYKYVRRFSPHLPAAPYSYYSLSMPSWKAWQRAWQEGTLETRFAALWEGGQPVEELYDTQEDPWEVHNLAGENDQQSRLVEFRRRLRAGMVSRRDTGIVPESLFADVAGDRTMMEALADPEFPYEMLLDLALTVSQASPSTTPQLRKALDGEHPCQRYWGAVGCGILGPQLESTCVSALRDRLSDPFAAVRIAAADALVRCGHRKDAFESIAAEFHREIAYEAHLQLFNTISQNNLWDAVPPAWAAGQLAREDAEEYVKRFARRVQERTPARP